MRISFSVALPADVRSVPIVRGLCRQALERLGADDSVVTDISLALTEACANVVKHSGTTDEFEVAVRLDADACRISVFDSGSGFDVGSAQVAAAGSMMEHGRGLVLMEQLVDGLHFTRDTLGRHEVVLERRLSGTGPLRLLGA